MATEAEKIISGVMEDLEMGVEVGSDYLYEHGDDPATVKVTKYNKDGSLAGVVGYLKFEEKL